MSVVDWFNQTFRKVGDFFNKTVMPKVTEGADWVNKNVLQPMATVAKYVPGPLSTAGGLVAKAGNVINEGLQSQWGDKRKFDVGKALKTGGDIYNDYQKMKKLRAV